MAAKKKAAPPPEIDWPAALRTGPEGVALWNARSETARQMTRLGRGDYTNCDLSGINFRGQSVLTFQGAGARFANAVLTNGSFIEADLRGADFTGAEMTKFCARNADLTGAKLPGGVLKGGRLVGAKFVGADLTGADLTGADLTGADFTGADLTGTVLAGLVFDQTTKWPEGFEVPPDAKWVPEVPPPRPASAGSVAAVRWAPEASDTRFSGVGEAAVAVNVKGLLARLHAVIDENRMTRVKEMLQTGTNQLFSEIEPAAVRGVVRSQREPELVYSCLIRSDGTYACATPDLAACMGLRGEPCKHLLVLLIGLTKAEQLDAGAADKYVVAAAGKKHKWNAELESEVADTLLRYKGAEAGEIDWRPTETVPEDFYAM